MRRLSQALLGAATVFVVGGCGARVVPVDAAAPVVKRSGPERCEPVGPAAGRQNLGPCINTVQGQALPRLSPDGRYLYFIRLGAPEGQSGEEIWYAERTEHGGWTAARALYRPLDAAQNNFILAVLDEGERLLVGNRYRADGRVEGGFSFVRREGAGWSAPEPVSIEGWHARGRWVSASLSEDGGVMVLHAEREGGEGGADLYVTFRREDGTWSEPRNLGRDVNTPGHEITPYLAADGVTLYFSSDGRGGLGGHDIFVTRRLDESWQRWSEPENLGPRINTAGFDAYFIAPAGDEYAYLASSTDAIGSVDIFRVLLREPRPEPVVVAAEPEPPPAVPELPPVPEPVRPRVGETIVLRGVYFDFDRATLRPESEKELQEVLRVLQRYPDIRAEIQGHTDGQGSHEYNDRLSSARAAAVRDYLVKHGIDPSRLEARGYGKRFPVATNDTPEGRQLNRRVELKILESGATEPSGSTSAP